MTLIPLYDAVMSTDRRKQVDVIELLQVLSSCIIATTERKCPANHIDSLFRRRICLKSSVLAADNEHEIRTHSIL